MDKINKKNFINIGLFLLVFVSTGTAFYFYQQHYFFDYYYPDRDSFYHVAMAKYMMENGWKISQFPWIQFSWLKENFVDWHFLYHIILMPFIKLFGEPIGPKLVNIALVGGIFSTIYLIFKEKKLTFAPLYAIVLFFLMPVDFYFRMSMIRAPVLVLFFFTLSLYWLIKNRPIALAITIFFFVWAYYIASILIFIPITAYLLSQVIHKEKPNYKILLWAIAGFVVGMVINPYFPNNLSFLITQLSVTWNYDQKMPYSAIEMSSPDAWWWFSGSMMAIILFFGGMVISLLKNIKQSGVNFGILVFAFSLLILQWQSVRNIEYWPVIGGLTGIIFAGPYLEGTLMNIKKTWRTAEIWIIIILLGIFIYEGIFHGILEYWETRKPTVYLDAFVKNENISLAREVSFYLTNHSNDDEIVFNMWDHFAPLFYFNQKNHYVAGMNPMFLKVYDQKLFEEYIDIYYYDASVTDLEVIKNHFNSKLVLVSAKKIKLIEKLQARKDLFEQVYENKFYLVFKVQ